MWRWVSTSPQLRAVCDAEEGGYPADPAFIAARDAARRTLAGTGHGAWFGAFLDGQLASQLGVFSDRRGVARYQEVATHPDARRQGLAATLLCHAARYATGHLAAMTLVIVADPGDSPPSARTAGSGSLTARPRSACRARPRNMTGRLPG
jgi:GNAT superfamily N-acetyltransferase